MCLVVWVYLILAPIPMTSLGNKAWLIGLSTEGQGLPEYPERKKYKKTQLNIPFGGGVKLALSDDVQVGVEIGVRKLFTDYLDDISTTYVDKEILFAHKGAEAVYVAFKGDKTKENPQPYPAGGTIRGSSKSKDYYYFGQLRISFRMNWFGNGASPRMNSGRKGGIGCPSW